jgi:DNA primase
MYGDDFLRMIRNKIKIDQVICVLRLETRSCKKLVRFRCPLCHGFHTATNKKTNLARCFDCKRNYNPIDLVMTVSRYDFVDTVEFLKRLIGSNFEVLDDDQRV